MKKCKSCGYELRQYSSKYYCCNKEDLYCSVCSSKKCTKCLNYRSTLLRSPQCGKCRSRVSEKAGFHEKKCGKYFCSRCLVKSLHLSYDQSFKMVPSFSYNRKKPVTLNCGHQCDLKEVQQYLRDYCIECGKQYRKKIDYELKDGIKLCYPCYNLFKDKYKKAVISCLSCGRQIDNHQNAGFADSEGLVLCQECVRQSKIQQAHLQKSRKINEPKKLQGSFYKEKQFQKQQKQQQSQNKKAPQNLKEKQVKQQQQLISQSTQRKQEATSSQKYKPLQIQQKQKIKIPESQPKQKYVFESPKRQSSDVVHKIINEMQECDQEMRKSLGLSKKPLLKKHLSDQTKVQNLQLDIQQIKKSEFITCKQCKSKVFFEIAYNVSKISSTKIKSSNLSSISTVESLRCDKEQVAYICRVCFLRSSFQNKKVVEPKDFSSVNNFLWEKSRLSQSRKPNNNFQSETSKMGMSRNFTISTPFKDHGLTGYGASELKTLKKDELIKKDDKGSIDFSSFKQGSQNMQSSTNYFSDQMYQNGSLRKRCTICGSTQDKLIIFSSSNFYCVDCLSTFRPVHESRASKIIY